VPGAPGIEQILEAESDEFVRDLLLFHEGRPCPRAEAIKYATRWNKEHLLSRSGALIRTMVLTGASASKIGQEMAATEENITVFEKLYFDVRPYLSSAAVIERICSSAVGVEKRWFAIARKDGWAGVEEAILLRRGRRRVRERNLDGAIGVMLNRVEDGVRNLEASGIEPGDRDLQRLAVLADIHATGLPAVWQEADEAEHGESTGQTTNPSFSKLPAGEREKVLFFLRHLMDKAAKKVAEAESVQGPRLANAESNASNTSVDSQETPVS
jgi:hypothetical protein